MDLYSHDFAILIFSTASTQSQGAGAVATVSLDGWVRQLSQDARQATL